MLSVNILLLVLLGTFLLSFIMNNYHLISLLVVLEGIMLVVMVMIYFSSLSIFSSSSLFLLILAFAACEAALGLCVLILVIRFYGNDLVTSISPLSWFA